jgi:autotransporter-associated beta strand protein
VTLTGPYLSAASVTVNEQSVSFPYTFTGSGSFAGPGNLIYIGSTKFTINNANTYSGGTIISNASAYLTLGNLNGLGTGPITLACSGGQMEIVPAASSSTGIASDVNVASNFTFIVDATNTSYGAVFNGNFSGTSGQTLTIEHNSNLTIGTNATRIRLAGNSTVYNANLVLGTSGDTNFLWACYQTGTQIYNGVISGPGSFMQKAGVTYLNAQNTYSGTTTPAAGTIGFGASTVGSPGAISSGPMGTGVFLLFADSSSASPSASAGVFASGGNCTIANAIQYSSTTNDLQLMVGGTNNLTFTGPVSLNGNDNFSPAIYTNRTYQTTNTAATTLAGVISGAGYGFIKTGPGALYLNAANTYTGLTSNNSSSTNGPALLAGSGSIAGPVLNQTNSAIGGGSVTTIGTLTINNALTNSGNVFIRVNKSLSPAQSNDMISVSGVLTNAGAGMVTVTNLGPALVAGDRFVLFSKALANGAALTITNVPALANGLGMSNSLAIDGSVKVVAVSTVLVPTNSPHITGFSLVSTNVVINATNGQSGGTYYLLASTNVAKPLNQWTVVATNVVNTNGASGAFTFIGTNVVGGQQQFYILSSTNN